MQFVSTFAVWILAERLGALGDPHRGRLRHDRRPATRRTASSARHRIASYAVWEVAVFVLNVLAFVLIGLQLRGIVGAPRRRRLARPTSSAPLAVLRRRHRHALRLGDVRTTRWRGWRIAHVGRATPPTRDDADRWRAAWSSRGAACAASSRWPTALALPTRRSAFPLPRSHRPLRLRGRADDAGGAGADAASADASGSACPTTASSSARSASRGPRPRGWRCEPSSASHRARRHCSGRS